MKPSFNKPCPHCSSVIKFKLGDDWKKSYKCKQCSGDVEFYAPRIRYFLYTFSAFWFLKSFDLFLSLPVAILIFFAITGFITIPFADLVTRKEPYSLRSESKKMYPVVQMIVLATFVNSVIIIGVRLIKIM